MVTCTLYMIFTNKHAWKVYSARWPKLFMGLVSNIHFKVSLKEPLVPN